MRLVFAAAMLLLAASAAGPVRANIPQHLIDTLANLSPYRVAPDELARNAVASLDTWRTGVAQNLSADEQRSRASLAARAAYRAGDLAGAGEAAAAVAAAASAPAGVAADASLLAAIIAFRQDASAEPALVQALGQGRAASPEYRSEAARLLALAHMRRDQQPQAQARWREAEAAAASMGAQTYHHELALLGRAASHGYANQIRDGLDALQTVMDRMRGDMARLNAQREMTAGEQIYAQALAWRTAFTLDRRSDFIDIPGYVQVGVGAPDAQGQPLCRGRFQMRPPPHVPIGAVMGRWRGATVLRLATDADGRVTHAEAVAAVPATPLFSRVTLDVAPRWRFIAARDLAPDETPCRLQSEGQLVAWSFH